MKLVSIYDSVDFTSRGPLKRYRKLLGQINNLADYYRAMTDDQLREASAPFRESFDIKNKKQVVHVFAIAREVTYRLLGKFQYDVQVLGALAALERNIIQMSTGSGKTVTIILPTVAFGLTRKGVNVLTVNEYLSKRDWEETRVVYDWFGLSNAYTSNNMSNTRQREAYACDVTYSTNSSLGFAYLNSCLASDIGGDIKVITRPLHAAIIDEADEILMDDARNPLIIASGSTGGQELAEVDFYGRTIQTQDVVDVVKTLENLGYSEDEGDQFLDDAAFDEIFERLGLDDRVFAHQKMMHVIYGAFAAVTKYRVYTDYIVQAEPDEDSGSRVILIDKATGRLARGRMLSDSLHSFVEMKEGVFDGNSSDTTIQITYQMLFNIFKTIAGVTGTVGTSFMEFTDIYGAGIVKIPDRLPNRLQQTTHLYTTESHMYAELLTKTRLYMSAHQPVLIGGRSDIDAEVISSVLTENGVEHRLLLSTDEDEDVVVASAGKPGSVVVTTDIMGRGTDIHVDDVDMERGLVVLQVGSRPNSRVERQFAGRAARQGQPGRYHRLLTVPELSEVGVMPSDISRINAIIRDNRELIEEYGGDVLLDGMSSIYEDILHIIDEALMATESAFSSSRVSDFRTYSIVDLIQVSLVSELDVTRQIMKVASETGDYEALRDHAVDLSFGDVKPKRKEWEQRRAQVADMDGLELLHNVFEHVSHVIHKLIPTLRRHSDDAINTVRMGQQVQYDVQPETHMLKHVQAFLSQHESELRFNI